MKLTDFDIYASLLKEQSGFILAQNKTSLLESRLSPIARRWGFESREALTNAVQGVPDIELMRDIVESMLCYETSFFRDIRPFEIFREQLMVYLKFARAREKQVRIWSIGTSSGQEPYSLAMILKDIEADYPDWEFEILASDISQSILEKAFEGVYSQMDVQRGVPVRHLMKYFSQIGDNWRLHDAVKQAVRFHRLNILEPLPKLGTFDIIFCRNVLRGFDAQTMTKAFDIIAGHLAPDGFLVLGKDESLEGASQSFAQIPGKPCVYAQIEGAHHQERSNRA